MSDEIVETSVFGDPGCTGDDEIRYFHILSSESLQSLGMLSTYSPYLRKVDSARLMTGVYKSRRIVFGPMKGLSEFNTIPELRDDFPYNFIHLKEEGSDSFIVGRINCIEYYPNHTSFFTVVRIPLFCLSGYLPQASQHRKQIFDHFTLSASKSKNSSFASIKSASPPLVAELWIHVQVKSPYEKVCEDKTIPFLPFGVGFRLTHPLLRLCSKSTWETIEGVAAWDRSSIFMSDNPTQISFS